MLKSKTDLRKPVQYLIFCNVIELARFRLVLVFILDLSLQIAIVCVVHDNTQLSLLSLVDFAESNDVGVVEDFEDLSLAQSFLAFFIAHRLNVNLLDDCILLAGLALDQVGGTEGPSSES
jgi:hypothetical protein